MITKDNNYKIMKLFFDSPEKKFYIREIARLTGISSTGVIKIIKRLKKELLLVSKKTKVVEEVRPYFSGRFITLKRTYNLYNVLDSKITSLLRDFYEEPEAIILFGSYAEGTDSSNSDIDIAIITKKENMPQLGAYERKLKKKISLYPVGLKKASDEFKNSIANGIVLNGFVEIIK